MVGIGADTTLRSSQPATLSKTVKATEITYCRTETSVSDYSENRGKPLQKFGAEHGINHNPRARRAGIEPTTIGASSSLTAHWDECPPANIATDICSDWFLIEGEIYWRCSLLNPGIENTYTKRYANTWRIKDKICVLCPEADTWILRPSAQDCSSFGSLVNHTQTPTDTTSHKQLEASLIRSSYLKTSGLYEGRFFINSNIRSIWLKQNRILVGRRYVSGTLVPLLPNCCITVHVSATMMILDQPM